VLHGDNGATLKATTVLAMLHWLGVKPSYSRPRVSDDNAYAEALFRTAKYRPEFPAKGFADLDQARTWAADFVHWYNVDHRHSGIRYVSPAQRHAGEDRAILAARHAVYQDQKDDLERQKQVLELYCAKQGWTFEVVADLGSGMNYNKKGLKRLLDEIIEGRVGRLVIAHKDRLLRFGAELVFAICEAKDVEVLIINKGVDTTFEEDLAKDVLEIITVFSARLYGSRSRKNQKLLDGVKKAVEAASC
jgi:putative resolvase